jgi:RimJ/RimL family protein N-acetyltransferase
MIAPDQFHDCRGGFALPVEPGIQTPRLTLRLPRLDDADALAENLNRFEVARMLPALPFPYDRQDALEWLLPRASGVSAGWSYLIDRGDGNAIGAVTIEHREGGWVFGYWLAPRHWGQGLMREAAGALVARFFENGPDEVLTASVLTDNPASFRILSGLGFRVTGAREIWCGPRGEMKTLIGMRLDASDFEAARLS